MDYDQLLDGCAEVGCRMLTGGAEIYRVEDTVGRMLNAYGVRGDVFAIPNSLIVSMRDETGRSYTRMRRTDTAGSANIEVVEQFNALSRAVCAQPPPPEQLPRLARETAERCRSYSPQIILLGYFLGAFFFTLFFQGGLPEALAAGAVDVLVGLCVLAMERLRVNFFFKTIAAAAVLGAALYGLRAVGLPINTGVAVIGALMVLVPGLVFTNFMCDLITGDALSGMSTFIRAVLTAAAIAVGVGVALFLFQTLGLETEGGGAMAAYGPAAQCAIAFLACYGFCLLYNVHGWGAVLCCLGGALGWAVYLAAGLAVESNYLRYLAAAVVIAVYAEVMARVRRFPITAYLVVSFFPLVPGSYIYYAMYYAIQGERVLFLETGIQALGLAACLAMGTLLVSTTVRTYTTWRRGRRG